MRSNIMAIQALMYFGHCKIEKMDKMLDEFKYVNRVVQSCITETQRINAMAWAHDWAKRMKALNPETIHSHTDLYLQVISK